MQTEHRGSGHTALIFWIVALLFLGLLVYGWFSSPTLRALIGVFVTEREQIKQPVDREEFELKDDVLADKNPRFDANLIDSRPFQGWLINQSAAVIKLDIVAADPRRRTEVLRPNYKAAFNRRNLPSVNLIDGAAKQFDDGLYAAIDLAVFHGEAGSGMSLPDLMENIYSKAQSGSPARPFLAGALSLVGKKAQLKSRGELEKNSYLKEFEDDTVRSQPAGFYTWNEDLKQLWRFCRYLQKQFDDQNLAVPRGVAEVLAKEPKLRSAYRSALSFYARLTNPPLCLSVDSFMDDAAGSSSVQRTTRPHRMTVAILPPATSREVELFDRLFPQGIPPNTNLMSELVRRIMSGQVDLSPDAQAGWYQWQVYALEVLLLPSKAEEKDKLLLTAKYKKRLLEAFTALITKRRETHLRGLGASGSLGNEAAPMPKLFYPRLRIEPAPTFYLRTARAYAFLENFLAAAISSKTLKSLYGFRKHGARKIPLMDELEAIKRRFYGFYLLSCDDIGLRPQFLTGEQVDQDASLRAANEWFDRIATDEDLAEDSRFAVPIWSDGNETRYWLTLGIREALLSVSYARPPKIRPENLPRDWQDIPKDAKITSWQHEILVEDFAEVSLRSGVSLSRDEWRAICDKHETKQQILEALIRQYGRSRN